MMRKRARPLDVLFPRTRQAVLATTLVQGAKWWYLSDLARHLGMTPSTIQRELAQLSAAGILLMRKDGNRVYFKANAQHSLYPELRRLFEKTSGMVDVLRKTVFSGIERRITAAFVYGSTARGADDSQSDIDLFVVGEVSVFDIAPRLRKAEKQLAREISATVFPLDEFAVKAKGGDHFLASVLGGEKVFIIGGEHDVEAAADTTPLAR